MTNIELLRTLVAVIDLGSVSAAARTRGYAASAVSRQLTKLRDVLGTDLFEPDGRGIRPTPAAREIAARVRVLIDEADSVDRYLGQIRAGRPAPIVDLLAHRAVARAPAGSARPEARFR